MHSFPSISRSATITLEVPPDVIILASLDTVQEEPTANLHAHESVFVQVGLTLCFVLLLLLGSRVADGWAVVVGSDCTTHPQEPERVARSGVPCGDWEKPQALDLRHGDRSAHTLAYN